jgi:hypothetical protein
MTGQVADYFVGGVSVVIGAVMLFFSAFNWDRFSTLRKPRWFEDRLGRSGARLFFAALGAALVALGIAIAAGFAPGAPGG